MLVVMALVMMVVMATCWRISCSSLAGEGMNPISQFSFTWFDSLTCLDLPDVSVLRLPPERCGQ